MAVVDQRAASLDLPLNVGDDFSLSVAVTENGSTWSSTGATVATTITDMAGTVQATNFTTQVSDGSLTLSLTDTQTTTLGTGTYRYAVEVTKSSLTRSWLAGKLIVSAATTPGGNQSATASLSISNGTVTLGITTLVAPNASNISVTDTDDLFDGTTVESALAELAGPTLADITFPSVWAHRGGATLRPENTQRAFDGALNEGIRVLDADARVLADGNVALFHDATVDATTSSTGNVATFRSSDIQSMVVDCSSFLSTGSVNTVPMLLTEFLLRYKHHAVLTVEAKTSAACTAIIAAADRLNFPKGQLLIQSFTYADCLVAVAAGYPALFLTPDLTSATAATLAADGVMYVGANTNLTAGNVAPFTALGIKVGAYTYDTRAEWATLQAAGVDFVWSNDPSWVASTSGSSAADPYSSKVPWPGRIASTNGDSAAWSNTADHGETSSTATNYRGRLQGWMGQLTASSYTITFQAAIDAVNGGDTTRWGSVLVCVNTDAPFNDSGAGSGHNGYHCLFRASGQIALFKVVNGTATSLQTQTLTAPTLGVKYTYSVAVTPTTVTFQRTDTPGSTCTTSDTAGGRGGYVWMGRNGASVRYSNVAIT